MSSSTEFKLSNGTLNLLSYSNLEAQSQIRKASLQSKQNIGDSSETSSPISQ